MRQRGFAVWQIALVASGLMAVALWGTWAALGECHEERASLRVKLAELGERVKEQNAKVEELERAAKDRAARATKAIAAAKAEGRGLEVKIAALQARLAKPTLQPGGCAAALGVAESRRVLR